MPEQKSGSPITVLGTGAFGTAIALVLAEAGARVMLWGRNAEQVRALNSTRENALHLPGAKLPPAIEVTGDLREACAASDTVFEAVPTQHVREVITAGAAAIRQRATIVSLSKGIERGTNKRISEVLREVAPHAEPAVLSGPSHAEEIALRQPTTVVVAADKLERAAHVQRLLATPAFRVYTNRDLLGVELGGATKNVIAIAAGILDGLALGDNTKAALLTRGLAEIVRLGVTLGAQTETFFGLAGVGDLVTTCYSKHGRNRALGEALGRGETLASYRARTVSVAEGAFSVAAILELATAHGVSMPICTEVQSVMWEGKPARQALLELMTRSPKEEALGPPSLLGDQRKGEVR